MPLTDFNVDGTDIVKIDAVSGSLGLRGTSGYSVDVTPEGVLPVTVVSGAFSGSFTLPDLVNVRIRDAEQRDVAVSASQQISLSQPAVMVAGSGSNGKAYLLPMIYDNVDADWRVATFGRNVSVPPVPPVNATAVTISGSVPLTVSTSETSSYTIPSGSVFYLQQIVAGAEGDPNERGSKVEVFYFNGTSHILERIYMTGFSVFAVYNDVKITRDNVTMVGNGTNQIRIVRTRLGGGFNEIDVVLRGYHI